MDNFRIFYNGESLSIHCIPKKKKNTGTVYKGNWGGKVTIWPLLQIFKTIPLTQAKSPSIRNWIINEDISIHWETTQPSNMVMWEFIFSNINKRNVKFGYKRL